MGAIPQANYVFVALFTAEAVLKIAAMGFTAYWRVSVVVMCRATANHHRPYTSSTCQLVGCKSGLAVQHLNTHNQELRALGLQIIIHLTHAPVHKQSHRLTVTKIHQGTDAT
jgi:hypothetical protein